MPGSAALCEPIGLQSIYIYIYTLKVFKIIILIYLTVNFLITPATETFIYKFFGNYAVTIIKNDEL